MSYMTNGSSFDSVFGKAADGIKFDKVIDAEEDDSLVEAVLALSEVSDGNDDFDETQGEDHKDPEDIKDELEGRPDDGNNDVTDSLDIDLAAEMALIESSVDPGDDFDETQGEDHKKPSDIKDELEGRPDDGCNKHTGGFDGYNNNSINDPALSMGGYHSADSDLHDIDGATDRAARAGESEYKDGDLSTEMAIIETELMYEDSTLDIVDSDTFESEELTGDEDASVGDIDDDYDGVDGDYTGVDDDFDGIETDFGLGEAASDGDDPDFDDDGDDEIKESAEADDDNDLIDIADEDDGELSAAEIDALVAAGGDDDLLDSM